MRWGKAAIPLEGSGNAWNLTHIFKLVNPIIV